MNNDIKIIDGPGCFTADTKIQTKDGYKYIKDIKIDDEVYSQNTETGKKGLKKVKNIFLNEVSTLIHLTVNNIEIKTTKDHPFWVKGKGWIAAGKLTLNDELIDYDGSIIKIQGITIEELDGPMTVYNFEVEDWHTYFVSENEVLVHNDCMVKVPKGTGKLDEIYSLAKNYNLDESQYLNHIIERHGYGSIRYPNKSNFSSSFDIKKGINEVLTGSESIIKPNTNGRSGYIFEQTFDNVIVGYDKRGRALHTLKVVINQSGNVITSFPKK